MLASKPLQVAESIRAVFNTNAQALRFLPDTGTRYSIKDWMTGEKKPGSILFITSTYTDLELNRALLTLWSNLAIHSLMTMSRTRDLRTWFMFDELGALHRLPAIENGLQTARNFGGAMVLGLHSFDKLIQVYGEENARNLSSLARTKLILAAANHDTAEVCSQFIGNREIRQMDEGYTRQGGDPLAGLREAQPTRARSRRLRRDAAEVADMGISFRLDMCEEDVRHAARAAILDGNAPAGPAHELFAPAEALQGLREHRAALDAAVWAAEEGEVAFLHAARGHGGGRFRLSEEENARYQVDRIDAAKAAMTRHDVGEDAAIALCRFLAERWREWDREGRPLIAEAYRIHLAAAVRLLQLAHGLAFSEIAVRVGPGGRMDRELLRDVWPDWAAEQRERVATTLRPSLPTEGPGALSDDELEAFARFLEDERQDAFFLRLASFETNAFDGDAPSPINGMTSDMQGMAVAVEHVVRAMGGTGDQLYSMFKQLWAGSAVEPLLKTHAQLARNAGLMKDWPELKARIATVAASGEAEAVAATLIMAHRLRGAVHVPVPEDDQLELEALFVRLMAAAAMTHAHVARRTAVAQPVPAPAATGSVAE